MVVKTVIISALQNWDHRNSATMSLAQLAAAFTVENVEEVTKGLRAIRVCEWD